MQTYGGFAPLHAVFAAKNVSKLEGIVARLAFEVFSLLANSLVAIG